MLSLFIVVCIWKALCRLLWACLDNMVSVTSAVDLWGQGLTGSRFLPKNKRIILWYDFHWLSNGPQSFWIVYYIINLSNNEVLRIFYSIYYWCFGFYMLFLRFQDLTCKLVDQLTFLQIWIVQIQKYVFSQMLQSRVVDNFLHFLNNEYF